MKSLDTDKFLQPNQDLVMSPKFFIQRMRDGVYETVKKGMIYILIQLQHCNKVRYFSIFTVALLFLAPAGGGALTLWGTH